MSNAAHAHATVPTDFTDTISRMMMRVTNPQQGAQRSDTVMQSKDGEYGPFTMLELQQLSFLCTTQDCSSSDINKNTAAVGFSSVDGDLLVTLIEELDRHVTRAISIKLIDSAIDEIQKLASPSQAYNSLKLWLKSGNGEKQFRTLRAGLEAAAIILFITTSHNVDRRVISEDAINTCITLFRMHLTKHLLPALNQANHFVANTTTVGTPTTTSSTTTTATSSTPTFASPTGTKHPRAIAEKSCSVSAKDLKIIYKSIYTTIHQQLVLMDRLERLLERIPLDGQQVLLLTNGTLPAFEIDCYVASTAVMMATNNKSTFTSSQLQLASIGILVAAFRKYASHRDTILEDLYPIMLRLPTGKRSLRFFHVSYQSAMSPNTLQIRNTEMVVAPLLTVINPNNYPPGRDNNDNRHYIQMMTALVISLVQACVVQPTYQVVNSLSDAQSDEHQEQDDNNTVVRLKSGSCIAQAVADSFVAHLLHKCSSTRIKGDGASVYRPVLVNFVEDLLLVLIIPEYPGAELLLVALQRRLNLDLQKASSIFGGAALSKQQVDTTYMNSVFDVMGKICAVQARILATNRTKPINMITEAPNSTDNNCAESTQVNCLCQQKQTQDVLIVVCDQCNMLYHGVCVGIHDQESAPDQWFCDACCLGKIAKRERRFAEKESKYIDFNYILHHSFQAATVHRLGVDMNDAVHMHLARWVDDLAQHQDQDTDTASPPRRLVSKLMEYWDELGPAAEPLTEEGSVRVILALMANTSPLLRSFRMQIVFLLKVMADESTNSLRKLSLKVIEMIVEADHSMMTLPIITKAVSLRLRDESISVREAAVSLVGSYIIKSPLAIHTYHSALVPCLEDPGVSVRKRAVKIIRNVLINNPRYQGRSAVCNILLKRSSDPKEEDIVRDHIDDLFCALWLSDNSEEASSIKQQSDSINLTAIPVQQAIISGIPGVVTPNTPAPMNKRTKTVIRRSDVSAEQMMEVVRSNGGSGEHLEALMKKLLNGDTDSDNVKKESERLRRQEIGQRHCIQIVESLFELLMVIEEQRDIRIEVGKDLAATLSTIAVFAVVAPHSVLKHLDTLCPYFKADNSVSLEDESAIICAASSILVHLSFALDRNTLNKLSGMSLATDLTKICYKYGPSVLGSTVRAFSALAHHPDSGNRFSDKLLRLAKIFYKYLISHQSIEDLSTSTEKIKTSAHRALTVLGWICECHEGSVDSETWTKEVESRGLELLPDDSLSWDNITLACYRLFTRYLQKLDSGTKCKALSAMKGIFLAHPQLLLQMDHVGLFDKVMSDDAGVPLQLEALQCWRSILTSEERRLDSGQADAKMDANGNITVSKRISGDQDGDATLFGGVLTSHADRLFEMIHSKSVAIRRSTLQLLELLLRQGLLNPNEAVPHLFALQGDVENEEIRALALRLLITEGEKRPDVLRQRIADGVMQAYKFQRSMNSNKEQVSALIGNEVVGIKSIFHSVFTLCIASNRKQRLSLFKSLVSLFDTEETSANVSRMIFYGTDITSKDLNLLSFASQILAYLPYTTAADPLYIVHTITSILTLQGMQLLEKLTVFLRKYGLASGDELDEATIDKEDALEIAARSKFPSRTEQARLLSLKSFDIISFMDLCRDGVALTLLCRLKTFLCTAYNLTTTRILEYDPNAKEVRDKLISKSISNLQFDGSIEIARQYRKTTEKDVVIRSYAHFRKAMRDENKFFDTSIRDLDATDDKAESDEGKSTIKESSAKRPRYSPKSD